MTDEGPLTRIWAHRDAVEARYLYIDAGSKPGAPGRDVEFVHVGVHKAAIEALKEAYVLLTNMHAGFPVEPAEAARVRASVMVAITLSQRTEIEAKWLQDVEVLRDHAANLSDAGAEDAAANMRDRADEIIARGAQEAKRLEELLFPSDETIERDPRPSPLPPEPDSSA